MIPIRDLFESHLTVSDLDRAMAFYGRTLGLELARVFPDRRVAFYWIGGPGQSMLGLWEAGSGPQRLSLHVAFKVDLQDLLGAPSGCGPKASSRTTSTASLRTSPSCSLGCPRQPSIFTIPTATCSNTCQCSPMRHSPN